MNGFGGAARFVVENYGDSELARRFGVKRYPAIFVDDVLVATPKDFGFYGKGEGEGGGRYAPLKSAASHDGLRADLTKMIELVLAGRKDDARAAAAPSSAPEIAALPSFTVTDVEGRALTPADLAGRVVLVEFWATWCPPCRGTLAWLAEVKKRYGDRVAVVTLAVESDADDVRARAAELGAPMRWALVTPEIARAFGDISAVPTLFVFDGKGRAAGALYGAPPTLHAEAEAKIEAALTTAR